MLLKRLCIIPFNGRLICSGTTSLHVRCTRLRIPPPQHKWVIEMLLSSRDTVTLMTNHHDHCSLESIIGSKWSGDSTSFTQGWQKWEWPCHGMDEKIDMESYIFLKWINGWWSPIFCNERIQKIFSQYKNWE